MHSNSYFGKKIKKMPKLKEIKTLGGSIVKIEISVAELKIAANFKRVIRIFPKKKLSQLSYK
jgi:hypothetical protein